MSKNRCEEYLAKRSTKRLADDAPMKVFVAFPPDNWTENVQLIASAMGSLQQEASAAVRLALLEQRMKMLEERQSRNELLTTLAPLKLKLRRNIPISIMTNGDDFIATFFDANISATGDTAGEAVMNIKDILVLKFLRLSDIPESSLAPVMKRQLAVLREFIEE